MRREYQAACEQNNRDQKRYQGEIIDHRRGRRDRIRLITGPVKISASNRSRMVAGQPLADNADDGKRGKSGYFQSDSLASVVGMSFAETMAARSRRSSGGRNPVNKSRPEVAAIHHHKFLFAAKNIQKRQ